MQLRLGRARHWPPADGWLVVVAAVVVVVVAELRIREPAE